MKYHILDYRYVIDVQKENIFLEWVIFVNSVDVF